MRKKTVVLEKGNALKILEWFRLHKDEGYANIVERAVKKSREELALG
jgi:hypothetical protein